MTKFFIATLSLSTYNIAQAAALVCKGLTTSGKTIKFIEENNSYLTYGKNPNAPSSVTISIDGKDFIYPNAMDRWDRHLTGYINFNDNVTTFNITYEGHFNVIKNVKFSLKVIPNIAEEAFFPIC